MQADEQKRLVKRIVIIAAFFVLAAVFYRFRLRGFLIAYVVIVPLLMVLAILLQSGKGGGLTNIVGGMGADSLFGTRSSTPIAKATYVMGALFLFICMLISRLGSVTVPEVPGVIGGQEAPSAEQPINIDVPGETEGLPEEDLSGSETTPEDGGEQSKEAPPKGKNTAPPAGQP